jgi:hypothetical protein
MFLRKAILPYGCTGKELVKLAASKKIVNKIGYHNKFVGTFSEVRK